MAVTQLFNRVASVTVGQLGQVGKDFEGLRVNFSIEKNSESNPNQAKVQIFNLSSASRSFVEQKNLYLILNVGYQPPGESEAVMSTLCRGDVKYGKVTNELKGGDWITSFEVGDGEIALSEKTFDKTFEKGVSLEQAIKDVAASFGLALGSVKGIVDKVYKSGLTLSGGTKQILDVLTKEAGVEWSIQDGEVQIIPPTGVSQNEAILIAPHTGLLNSPIKREKGIEFTSLIVPTLRPGRQVLVESSSVNGTYRIRKVTFTGDTHEGEWTAKVEAV